MYMLQLFNAADEVRAQDARLLREGLIRLGRDTKADWFISDPACELSRAHLEVEIVDGQLLVRALGANGVFDNSTGDRLPDQADIALTPPASLRFGQYRLKVTQSLAEEPIDPNGTLIMSPPLGHSATVPDEWSDHEPVTVYQEGSLLEAFCAGAGLDASMLSGEDPSEIMRRAGAIYRQTVLGVGDLMKERDAARQKYKLTRTTIGGANNNPFKWAPSQRLAIDLLLAESRGFLSGSAALQASFIDVKRHLIATFAGLQSSLREAINTFSPDAVAKAANAKTSLLKSRTAAQCEEAAARHANLASQIDGSATGSLERAFVIAYDSAEQVRSDKAA